MLGPETSLGLLPVTLKLWTLGSCCFVSATGFGFLKVALWKKKKWRNEENGGREKKW